MHVPDGFFTAPVSIAAAGVAAAAVAVSLRKAKLELEDRAAPMAGLVAAFIFGVQMLNFPVAAGTSGHLLGGALAAILVGPYTAVLCIATVLLVQGFFFADGGLTALGINITLMGVVTAAVAWGVFRLVARGGHGSVVAGSFLAAFLSVPAAALGFAALFAIGGTAPVDSSSVALAMGGTHLLIGIGEGLITAVTVSSVLAVRPDLVYGARGLARPLVLRTADGERVVGGPEPAAVPARPAWSFAAGMFAVAVVLAGVVSFFASSEPDGLEKVAGDEGFLGQATDHAVGDWFLADYGDVGGVPVGIAGVIGVVLTLALGLAVTWTIRRRKVTA